MYSIQIRLNHIESGKHVIRINPSCYNQKPWLFTIHKTSSGCMVK
ncbi:hypothetical protein VCHA43P282_380001 [Vibrio chagasii]|nr:hypothetical protein VCHA43P282_380001 [Vibrio chagasii]